MSCKFLDLRADAAGGNLASEPVPWDGGSLMSAAALEAAINGQDVLLSVHGFNVNRAKGIANLTGWRNLLDIPRQVFFGVLWPGDSRWLPVLDYPIEGGEAMQSGALLGSYLNKHFASVASLSFVSHSLGARVVLETIRNLDRRVRVRQLVMMAGAIDDDCLFDEYKDAAATVDCISALASRKDEVLALAFPVGNLLEDIVTPSHPFWHAALGRTGPRAPYPSQLRGPWQLWDSWGFGHGDYMHGSAASSMGNSVDIGPETSFPATACDNDTKPAWTAAFVSSRLR